MEEPVRLLKGSIKVTAATQITMDQGVKQVQNKWMQKFKDLGTQKEVCLIYFMFKLLKFT